MERFSCNIKKFQETEALQKFLIFPEMEPFSLPPENFLYFREEKPQKRLIFSQKKAFLIFWKMETPKKMLYFRKGNFLIFQKTLKNFARTRSKLNFVIFQEVTCKA